jgi:hypothetical protein
MCTTRLNNGMFRVHRFSVVTPARLHKSDFVFRFYVYGGTFDNPRRYLLSARGTIFGALCAHRFFGFVGTTNVLSGSVSNFVAWDGELPCLVVLAPYRGSIAGPGKGFFYLIF